MSEGDRHLRAIMRRFATGIAVVTTAVDGQRFGVTANSLTSVSLQPPLLLVCIARYLRIHAAIHRAGHFAVNLLDAGQEDLSRHFAGQRPGRDPFDGLVVDTGATGAPLLRGGLGALECRLAGSHPGGDHTICVGEVLHGAPGPEGPALVYYLSRYHSLSTDAG